MRKSEAWLIQDRPEPAETMDPASFHRSGVVARMLRMPVSTLRVWERRYGLTQPTLSAGGQRLYSAQEVRRLTLLKQLTDLGHAIGSLARLDTAQLKQVAETHARAAEVTLTDASPQSAQPSTDRAWRVAVIGATLAERLKRPALLRRLGRPVQFLGAFTDASEAAATLHPTDIDVLLIHAPQLHQDWQAQIDTAAPALKGVPKAVLYSYAATAVCEALSAGGTLLLREPQPDAMLTLWLRDVCAATVKLPSRERDAAIAGLTLSAPRWNDSALEEFAGQASAISCECPRHVADLLMQLSRFESYSAQCQHRSPADAKFHDTLRKAAAEARVRFESVLEYVALHEGLVLPLPS